MTILLFLTLLAATLAWGGWIVVQRCACVNRRIDADVVFLRSIPSDMDWRDDSEAQL